MHFVLASQSPARLRILQEAGVHPIVRVSQVDEDAILETIHHASPKEQVCALATAKGTSVASHLCSGDISLDDDASTERECVLVACDSMLESNGQLLGKPHDPETALRRVRELSNAHATLWSGHYLARLQLRDGKWHVLSEHTRACSTEIYFGSISENEAQAYVASGEPLEVAGSYPIDGLGGAFINQIEGDHHNVIGISLPLIRQMMADQHVEWTDLWHSTSSTSSDNRI